MLYQIWVIIHLCFIYPGLMEKIEESDSIFLEKTEYEDLDMESLSLDEIIMNNYKEHEVIKKRALASFESFLAKTSDSLSDEVNETSSAALISEPESYSMDEATPKGYTETEKIWSDEQCKKDTWISTDNLDDCKKDCDKRASCTAFQYAERKGCALRKCPVPIPEPTVVNTAFKGYYLTELAENDGRDRDAASSNTDSPTTNSPWITTEPSHWMMKPMVWSDRQCRNMGWLSTPKWRTCGKKCASTPGCNAFQFGLRRMKLGCYLRECPTPVPKPLLRKKEFIGYVKVSEDEYNQEKEEEAGQENNRHSEDNDSYDYVRWDEKRVWSSSQCDRLGFFKDRILVECMYECNQVDECTAFNYARGIGCYLLACPIPLPKPAKRSSRYRGYYKLATESMKTYKGRQISVPTINNDPVSWEDAINLCHDKGMEPFMPHTSGDYRWLEEVVQELGGLRGLWLPATDYHTKGTLLWSNGQRTRGVNSELYWFDGEERRHDREDSNCLEFVNHGKENSLIMTPCDWQRHPMICIEHY